MAVHKIQPDLFQHHASSAGFGKHPAVFLRFLYGETSVRTATDLRCESPVSGRKPICGRWCRDLGLRPSVLSFQFHRESLRLFRKHEGDSRRRGFFPQFKHLLCCGIYTDSSSLWRNSYCSGNTDEEEKEISKRTEFHFDNIYF